MKDLKEILWYLLPGGFVVFPLLLGYSTKEPLVEIIIFSALLVGFIIHLMFRILFHYFCYGRREVSIYFKSLLMKYLREGKVTFQQLGVDTINNQRELEKVYNYYILYILFFFIVLGFIKITNDRMNDHEIYLIDKIDSTYKEEIFKWEDVPPNKK